MGNVVTLHSAKVQWSSIGHKEAKRGRTLSVLLKKGEPETEGFKQAMDAYGVSIQQYFNNAKDEDVESTPLSIKTYTRSNATPEEQAENKKHYVIHFDIVKIDDREIDVEKEVDGTIVKVKEKQAREYKPFGNDHNPKFYQIDDETGEKIFDKAIKDSDERRPIAPYSNDIVDVTFEVGNRYVESKKSARITFKLLECKIVKKGRYGDGYEKKPQESAPDELLSDILGAISTTISEPEVTKEEVVEKKPATKPQKEEPIVESKKPVTEEAVLGLDDLDAFMKEGN